MCVDNRRPLTAQVYQHELKECTVQLRERAQQNAMDADP